jgi:hypothetical protein
LLTLPRTEYAIGVRGIQPVASPARRPPIDVATKLGQRDDAPTGSDSSAVTETLLRASFLLFR